MPASSRSCGRSRLRIISAMPNRPMAIGTKLMPSVMSGMPNVMRGAPEFTSMPTRPTSTPTMIMAMALAGEPCASTTAPSNPRMTRLTVSTAVNLRAKAASGRLRTAITSVATVPAKNEAMAAIASAEPARPCRAIW